MRVSISGTQRIPTPAQERFIRERILKLPPETTVITGGCVGVDALVAEIAYHSGYLIVHTILPADHKKVDPVWRRHCHSFVQMSSDTSYRDRDVAVVEDGNNLLAFPLHDEWVHATRTGDVRSARSGTWMTIRIGRGIGRPVEVFVLDQID